uniref:Uncharacterized protein n=1 Tax=Malurus cyaneus samueli TaxID=2593467 RepID=A0A8C5UN07_9PASS
MWLRGQPAPHGHLGCRGQPAPHGHHGLRGQPAPPRSPWAAGDSLLHHGHHGLRGQPDVHHGHHGSQGDSLLHQGHHGLAGDSLLHHGHHGLMGTPAPPCPMGLQGNSLLHHGHMAAGKRLLHHGHHGSRDSLLHHGHHGLQGDSCSTMVVTRASSRTSHQEPSFWPPLQTGPNQTTSGQEDPLPEQTAWDRYSFDYVSLIHCYAPPVSC